MQTSEQTVCGKIITEYLKPIFGFALKRCKNAQDAEDLSQEIVLQAFRTLMIRDDIANTDKFIWTIAHNALANYYRDDKHNMIGASIDDIAEVLPDPASELEGEDEAEIIRRLHRRIAYLSKLQRQIIIAYYFENKKQAEIARALDIPVGTVKWHLFEAKKELKRGMDTMRKPSELKFHPIKFHNCGINGSAGTKSPDEFFRSALSQNICYCVRNTAKTINEIADDLGVSPVYVETEVEFLEEYGFLLAQKGRYIINFLISEPTAQLLTMQNEMYRKAAELYANDLYDALIVSGIPELEGIRCCQSDKAVSLTESAKADRNFLLWALIPYIVARAGETMMNNQISFEEVATLRPDGGHNIYHATVLPGELILPDDYVYMKNWCGPMWNCVGDRMLWQVDSQWCDRKTQPGPGFAEDSRRILSLYLREQEERLSRDEYAWLAERGVIKTNGDYDGFFKAAWQIVVLADRETQEKLLSIGEVVKLKHFGTFEKLKKPYVEAVLESVPAHLRKLRAYELQYLFHSDGWFLLHCIRVLLDNGKLKEPTPGQRKALSTIMVYT